MQSSNYEVENLEIDIIQSTFEGYRHTLQSLHTPNILSFSDSDSVLQSTLMIELMTSTTQIPSISIHYQMNHQNQSWVVQLPITQFSFMAPLQLTMDEFNQKWDMLTSNNNQCHVIELNGLSISKLKSCLLSPSQDDDVQMEQESKSSSTSTLDVFSDDPFSNDPFSSPQQQPSSTTSNNLSSSQLIDQFATLICHLEPMSESFEDSLIGSSHNNSSSSQRRFGGTLKTGSKNKKNGKAISIGSLFQFNLENEESPTFNCHILSIHNEASETMKELIQDLLNS